LDFNQLRICAGSWEGQLSTVGGVSDKAQFLVGSCAMVAGVNVRLRNAPKKAGSQKHEQGGKCWHGPCGTDLVFRLGLNARFMNTIPEGFRRCHRPQLAASTHFQSNQANVLFTPVFVPAGRAKRANRRSRILCTRFSREAMVPAGQPRIPAISS